MNNISVKKLVLWFALGLFTLSVVEAPWRIDAWLVPGGERVFSFETNSPLYSDLFSNATVFAHGKVKKMNPLPHELIVETSIKFDLLLARWLGLGSLCFLLITVLPATLRKTG